MTKVDIFSGFLGAGKTTLIKKLIAEAYAGEQLVLIENEFGEIGIDGGFLQDAGVNITEMNSGCICCSLVGDFGNALQKVLDQYHPDRILIEPSGVGKLSDVIRAVQNLHNAEIHLESFTTVVDAKKCKMYQKNFGEFFNNQIEHASCLILSHTAGLAESKLEDCVQRLRALNTTAPIVTTDWEQLSGEQLLSAMNQTETLDSALKNLLEETEHEHEHDHEHEHEHEDDTPSEPKPINNTTPLWMKKPSECTDEEYKEFYRNVFMDFNEPLFWIHLNVDYPFNLKGILYFPKINHEFAGQEGQIKLYNNQVFVADNVKEVIPEFLMLLKGVIDCPDLPLNVSRSFLQNDGYVKKISSHITKKVADKLASIYNNERENYEKYWDYINIFIKYGCLRDEKFYEKVKDVIIYKDIDGKYLTLDEYLDGKEEKDVYYVSDPQTQSQYINMFKNQGLNAVVLPSMMDTHFISLVEMKQTGVKFKRIDSAINDISDNTEKDDSTKEQEEKLIEKFKNEIKDDTLKIEVQSLKDDSIPAVILLGEQSRRMQEMYKAYGQQMAGMADMFHDEFTLVLNSNNSLIKKIDTLNDEDANLVIEHVYDLAKISHSPLPAEQMTKFIERSNKLLEKLF